MSEQLAKLKVVLEATTVPLKKEMEKSKQIVRDTVSDIRKRTNDIKSPLEEFSSNRAMPSIRKMRQNLKKVMSSANSDFKSRIKDFQINAGIRVYTDDFLDTEEDIEKAERSLKKLKMEEKALMEMGENEGLSEKYRKVKKSADEAGKALEKLLRKKEELEKGGNAMEFTPRYQKIYEDYRSGQNRLSNLKSEREKRKSKNLSMLDVDKSGTLINLEDEILKTETLLERLGKDMEALENKGKMLQPTQAMQKLKEKIEAARNDVGKYKTEMAELTASGLEKGTAEWIKNQKAIAQATKELEKHKHVKSGLEQTGGDTTRPSLFGGTGSVIKNGILKGWGGASKIFGGMKATLSKVTPVIKKVSGVFGALLQKFKSGIPSLNKTSQSMDKLKNSGRGMGGIFNAIAMSARFMLASLLIRAPFEAIKAGMQNLAQYSGTTNASLSMLMSSLTQLKNAFAAAFAPILNVVTPILDAFIQKIITVVNAIGQFFGALTGQTSYVRAKKVNQDYAASLGQNAENADKANEANQKLQRTILGFDQINKMDDNSGSSGSGNGETKGDLGGLSPNDMFETVTIDNRFKNLADKVRNVFAQIFKPMKDAWDSEGKNVVQAWKYALDSVIDSVKSIGKSFLDVWTNGTGEQFCTNILKLVTQVGNMVGDIGTAFQKAWAEGERGTKFIQSIFDKFNAILELIHTVGESLRTVWNSGSGEKAIGFILEIFTDINDTVTAIAKNLKKAWESNNTGTEILQGIADIIVNLLGHVRNITKAIKDWASKINFSPLLKSVNGLVKALKPLGKKVGAGLEWFFKNVLQPVGKWLIEKGLPKLIDMISAAFEALDAVLDALKPVAKWLWEEFLEPLGKWTGGAIEDILDGIGNAFKSIAEYISGISDIIENSDGFLDGMIQVGKYLIEGLLQGILAVIKGIGSWLKENLVDPIVDKVKDLFGIKSPSTVFEEIGKYLIQGLLKGAREAIKSAIDWFKSIPKMIKDALGNAKDWLVENGKNAIEGLKSGWESVKESKLGKTVSQIGAFVKNRAGSAVNWVRQKGKDAIEGLRSGWETVKEGTFLSKVSSIGTEVFGKIGNIAGITKPKGQDAIRGMQSGVTGSMSSLISVTSGIPGRVVSSLGNVGSKMMSVGKSMLNGLKSGIQTSLPSLTQVVKILPKQISTALGNLYNVGRNAISGLANGFRAVHIPTPHFSVGSSKYTIAGKSFSVPKISLKWYAAGGFPANGEMFVAREAGPEMVGRMGRKNAVANNTQIIEGIKGGVFEAVMDALQASGLLNRKSSGQNITLEFTLVTDSETLYKVVRKGKQKYDNRYYVIETI